MSSEDNKEKKEKRRAMATFLAFLALMSYGLIEKGKEFSDKPEDIEYAVRVGLNLGDEYNTDDAMKKLISNYVDGSSSRVENQQEIEKIQRTIKEEVENAAYETIKSIDVITNNININEIDKSTIKFEECESGEIIVSFRTKDKKEHTYTVDKIDNFEELKDLMKASETIQKSSMRGIEEVVSEIAEENKMLENLDNGEYEGGITEADKEKLISIIENRKNFIKRSFIIKAKKDVKEKIGTDYTNVTMFRK